MLTETGKIVRLEGNTAWIQTMRHSVCGACQAKNGCGQHLLNRLSGSSVYLELALNASSPDVMEGDQVEIGIEEGAVVMASLMVYGLPIIFLLFSIIVAGRLHLAGFGLLALCLAGIGGGAVLARVLIKHYFRATFFEPILLRRLSDLP